MSNVLTPAEESIMLETFRVTMLRAAAILARLTAADVLDAQRALLQQGCTFAQVAKIDRALIGEMHFRACAENLADERHEAQRRVFMLRKLALEVQPVEGGAAC